jgi:hypothetical protein
MNPLLSMMGGSGNNPMAAMMQAMSVVNQIRQTGNPQAAINAMAQQNPNIKKAMDMCKGKNPEQMFKQMCQQNGMDPEQFTGMMK